MTDAYLVERRLVDCDVSDFARSEFHGDARRPGAPYPLYNYRFSEKHEHPLRVTKNAYRIAPIFVPSLNWIVSQEVADIVRDLPHVALLRVEWQKLYSLPHEDLGEPYRWHHDDDVYLADNGTPLLETLEHASSLEAVVGPRFELIVEVEDDFAGRFRKGVEEIAVPTPNRARSRPYIVRLSRNILGKYPIFWSSGNVVRADVYERLEPYLNDRFFHAHAIALTER